jgi:DNA-binding CsgD family transcriptional regulator
MHPGPGDEEAELGRVAAGDPARAGAAETERLSVREFEVLRLLLEGRATDEMAATLELSPKRVRNGRRTKTPSVTICISSTMRLTRSM